MHVSTGHLTCQQKTQRGPWPCRRNVSSFSTRAQPGEIGFWFWLYKRKTWPAKANKKNTWDNYFWNVMQEVMNSQYVGCVCYLLWDEHKEQYSLYFSIYRAPSLVGPYHRGYTGGEGKKTLYFQTHRAPGGLPSHQTTPRSWRRVSLPCPFKPRRHPYRLLNAKKK
jgi:hypothetical protein